MICNNTVLHISARLLDLLAYIHFTLDRTIFGLLTNYALGSLNSLIQWLGF